MLRLQKPLPDFYKNSSDEELDEHIKCAKEKLGSSLMILGHHYQRDEVIKWADETGDSLALSKKAAARPDVKYIVFCGVHFMAESADILTSPEQVVILPDLNAGCSMADMADTEDVEVAWQELTELIKEDIIPITYINSSASLKAFVGVNGGSVCTSTNAKKIVSWALGLNGFKPKGSRLFFFPDQHLGRNTAISLGFKRDEMIVWDPRKELGGNSEQEIKKAKIILWKGHCSVHQRFTPEHVREFRQKYPDGKVVVHPECCHEVVELADEVGSTEFIIKTTKSYPPGTKVGIGTEIHLVNRLANTLTDKKIVSLDPLVCPCSTMFRIDLKHLAWVLDGLTEGEVYNRIVVDEKTAYWARLALETMLANS
jgi:quinolinate synthase